MEAPDLIVGAEQASRVSQQQVVDLRRCLDLLLARGDGDPKRIAYVGHSFDAHVGAILAGVKKRIQSFVLMAGAYADEENTMQSTRADIVKIRQQIGDQRLQTYFHDYDWDDPIHYLPLSSPAAVFLQFASQDQPDAHAQRYYAAFGEPKKKQIYTAGSCLERCRAPRSCGLAGRMIAAAPH